MLIGSLQHSIDPKGRYIVPVKYREDMGESFVIARGVDPCLCLYPLAEWQRVMERIREGSGADPRSRRFYRNYLANAFQVELDKQFRVVIPPELRAAVGLEKDVVTVGMSNRLELWERQTWLDYDADSASTHTEDTDNSAALLFW